MACLRRHVSLSRRHHFFFIFVQCIFFFLEIWIFLFNMTQFFAMKTHNRWIIFFLFFSIFSLRFLLFFFKLDGFIETEFFFSILFVWFFILTGFICRLIELSKKINDIIFFFHFCVVFQMRSQRQQVFFDWKQILIICQNYFYWKF